MTGLEQIERFHNNRLSAVQPVVHTLLLSGLVDLGNAIFESYSVGLTIYCLIQAILIIFTFSYLVVFLSKRKVAPIVLLTSTLLFACNPIIQILSFSTIKVTFFTCFFILLLLYIIEMLENPEEYFSKKRNILKPIIVAILMSLFRKQGIYIFIILIPILTIFLTKYWKKLSIIFFTVIILVFGFFGPISSGLKIKKSPTAEMLSIPMQQISAVIKYNRESLTEEDWNVINRYFKEKGYERYIPQISDPVKSYFNSEEIDKDKLSFIKLWIQLGIKNKQIYINSFLDMDIGYLYPSVETISEWSKICPFTEENEYDIKLNSLNKPYYDYLQYATNDFFEGKSILSLYVCEAMPLWVMLFVLIILIYDKKYKLIVPIIGLLLYLGTCLLAPVCCIRYIYPLLASLVLVIALPFMNKK